MKRASRLHFVSILLITFSAPHVAAESGGDLSATKISPTPEPVTLTAAEERVVEEAAARKLPKVGGGRTLAYPTGFITRPFPAELVPVQGEGEQYVATSDSKSGAACTYTGLTSGVTDSVLTAPAYYIANQSAGYWTAMAVRSDAGTDWDLHMYKGLGAAPGCVDTFLTVSSAASGVDVVVADFNHMPPTARYLEAVQYSGTANAQIEWDNGTDILSVNGGSVFRNTGPDDIIECWDVFLQGGVEYGFQISPTDYAADLKLLLFQNPAAAPYHARRTDAMLDTVALYPVVRYTPSSNDWYAVVVVNENGMIDGYTLEVGTCAPPVALVSGTGQAFNPGYNFYSIDQQYSYWTAVAVRPTLGGSDYILQRFVFGTGASWPQCFTGGQGISNGYVSMGRNVSILVGDFNGSVEQLGTYYLTSSPYDADSSGGVIEWDSGPDFAPKDGTIVARSTDPTDVIEMWDILLEKGTPYNFTLTSTGPVMMSIMWAPPAQASQSTVLAWGTDVSQCRSFTVDTTAFHGLSVINMNGGTGSYQFSVFEQFFDEANTVFADQPADGRGMAWSDFDGDGDLDVYVTNYADPNRLLINDGVGVFSDGTPPILDGGDASLSAAWGDFDNDGDADLIYSQNGGPLHLYRNENAASFSDMTAGPLLGTYTGSNVSWVDYDNDGFLDISLTNVNSMNLFHGSGNGSFTDETPAVIAALFARRDAWGDYDSDGDLDLYAVSSGANHLLRNEGDGSFTDVTAPPLNNSGSGYDAAWSDFDLDGDVDLFVANRTREDGLFRNDGTGAFADVSFLLPGDTLESNGAVWGDYDLNGYPDLFIAGFGGQNRLLAGSDGALNERTASVVTAVDYSASAAWADYDGDGDLDLSVVNQPALGTGSNQQINNALCSTNFWLNVDLIGVVSNRDGIGARITLYSSGKTYLREMTGKAGGFSSGPLLAHFGFPYDLIDSVVVEWPRGARQTVVSPAPKRTLVITEDTSYYVGVDNAGDAGDAAQPARLALHGNVPNPFNPSTKIRFDLPVAGEAQLAVYDVAGRQVRNLIDNQQFSAGRREVVWDGKDDRGVDAASGIYFYRLHVAGESITRKMLIIR